MLGRVRASTMGSLELLEMERLPSKIIKDDPLSIYESTLLKLKQGSNCNMATDLPDEDDITADPDSSSNSSSVSQSTVSSREPRDKNMSILYFFSKCKSSQLEQYSNTKEVMITDYPSSSSS